MVIGRKRKVKLFGTSLKSQLEETGEAIPDIVESCAKYIAKYGKLNFNIYIYKKGQIYFRVKQLTMNKYLSSLMITK